MSVKPALALKAAEVAQDPEDQGKAEEVGAVADRGKAEEVGAEAGADKGKAEEDDAFR